MKCEGCDAELFLAYQHQQKGFHLATSIDNELDFRKHVNVIVVDDDGEMVMW